MQLKPLKLTMRIISEIVSVAWGRFCHEKSKQMFKTQLFPLAPHPWVPKGGYRLRITHRRWLMSRVIQKIQTFQTVDITIKNNKILFFRAKLIQMCKNFSKIFIFRYCYFTSKFLEESLSKMTYFQQPDEVEKLIWSFF